MVGHKAVECGGIYEVLEEGEVDAGSKDVGGVWVVAGVEEMRQKGRCGHGEGKNQPPGLEESRPGLRTLEAFMPKKTEVQNSFKIFQVDEKEDEEDEEEGRIGGIDGDGAEEVHEVVEITVDSGASRSVWPKKKKGVTRTKMRGKKPRLQAANGTTIEVEGEATLEFEMGGKKCGMKFLDADVKKPLGAVSAMEDEGNTVVFSKKWGSYVENDATEERIPMVRKGGVYVMVLQAADGKGKKVKKMKDEDNVDVDGLSDQGEDVVFRRRMLM